MLHDVREILAEEESRSCERLGLASDQLEIPCSIAVALGHAPARIAGALALRAVARKRDQGSVEIHELVRAGRASSEAPRGVGGQRDQELQAPDPASLVAIVVHLRDTNGEGLTESRRLERDEPCRPAWPVVETGRRVDEQITSHDGSRGGSP